MSDVRVWLLDDDDSIRWVLEQVLAEASYRVSSFTAAVDLRLALEQAELPKVIISDVRMPGESGFLLLTDLKQRYPNIPVIMITAYSDLDSTVRAYNSGAFEYLPKPFDIEALLRATERAVEWSNNQQSSEISATSKPSEAKLIGEAASMQDVFRAIGRLSRSSISVMINGESGSGKELIARALHQHSPRSSQPFIALNVAAIPHELIESELFGHEKGAFTGAHSTRIGRFEQAEQGTLFLDEIGDMPIDLQTRLLRVLSDGQFYRVGGHAPITANVRVIAATHRDLEQRVQAHKFREDLFHRLNVIRICVPPLRQRRSDIPLLLKNFLAIFAAELGVEEKQLHCDVIDHLTMLAWPGNVRELENLCRWITVMPVGRVVTMGDIPVEYQCAISTPSTVEWQATLAGAVQAMIDNKEHGLLDKTLPIFERTLINCALRATGNNRNKAAKLIGWGRNTLTRKIDQLK